MSDESTTVDIDKQPGEGGQPAEPADDSSQLQTQEGEQVEGGQAEGEVETEASSQSQEGDQPGDGQSISGGQSISIDLQVPLVPQPTDKSCWAAALDMVISYRDQASYEIDTIVSQANMDTNTSYNWDQIRNVVSTWNLHEEGPMSAMPDYWSDLLERYGPIWIVEVGAPYHAVVVVGIQGDGTPETTTVTVNNPSPPKQGAVEQKTFLEFDQEFGLGAGAKAMIVHQ